MSYLISDFTGATIAEIDEYHSLRGNDLWTGNDTVKSQAMVRAWDYFLGLAWIDNIFTDSILPDPVKNAHAIASLEELKETGILLPVLSKEDYLKKKNTAGVFIKEYKDIAPAGKIFTAINSVLSGYLYSKINVPLIRG